MFGAAKCVCFSSRWICMLPGAGKTGSPGFWSCQEKGPWNSFMVWHFVLLFQCLEAGCYLRCPRWYIESLMKTLVMYTRFPSLPWSWNGLHRRGELLRAVTASLPSWRYCDIQLTTVLFSEYVGIDHVIRLIGKQITDNLSLMYLFCTFIYCLVDFPNRMITIAHLRRPKTDCICIVEKLQ